MDFDFGRPCPLLQPELWPVPSPDRFAVLPLELIIVVGGPLRDYFERLALRPETVIRVSPNAFRDSTTAASLRRSDASAWLRRHATSRLVIDGDPREFFTLFSERAPREVLGKVSVAMPTLEDWLRAFQPDVSAATVGELPAYVNEFPDSVTIPWEGLRFFAGFLRRRRQAGATGFSLAWSAAQALHSPQDEEAERRSLAHDQTMLNPTVQLVTRAEGIRCFWRARQALAELELDVTGAGIIDELQESGRLEVSALARAAGAHVPIARVEETIDRFRALELLL